MKKALVFDVDGLEAILLRFSTLPHPSFPSEKIYCTPSIKSIDYPDDVADIAHFINNFSVTVCPKDLTNEEAHNYVINYLTNQLYYIPYKLHEIALEDGRLVFSFYNTTGYKLRLECTCAFLAGLPTLKFFTDKGEIIALDIGSTSPIGIEVVYEYANVTEKYDIRVTPPSAKEDCDDYFNTWYLHEHTSTTW